MNLITIVGARPQFIKASVVSKELAKDHDETIVHTGQHYDKELSQTFFNELDIPEPDYNLGVGSDTPGRQTAQMVEGIEKILLEEDPELIILYGDTNSTLAGALAGSKLPMDIAHIEAGLRSFNKDMPEEINRVITDHVSDLLFSPTDKAVEHLEEEGLGENTFLVGDVMYDALLHNIEKAERESDILERIGVSVGEYYLITVHRQRNTDNKKNLKHIVQAILEVDGKFIFPAHPRVKKSLKRYGLLNTLNKSDEVKLIDPVGYLDFLVLEKNSRKILTDSGGIQKEAYFLDKPCITLRDETEWVETLDNGWNVLVGSDKKRILEEIGRERSGLQKSGFNYGDGKASENIVDIISKRYA